MTKRGAIVANRSKLTVLFCTVTLDLIGFGMVVPLMPLYAQRMAASGAAIAWLMASYSLMQFFCAPLWGRLSDRIGRRPVLLVSIFANALALLLFACSGSYWQLLLSRMFAGVCSANISVASAYVADVTEPQARARGMGMIGAAFGLGFVLGPFAAGELSQLSLSAPPLVAAGLALLNGLSAVVWLPESLPVAQQQLARSKVRQAWWQERIAPLLLAPRHWPLFVLVFLQVAGFAMMEMALVLFVRDRFGLQASGSGRLLAYVGVVMVAVQGGGIGPLVRHFGEAKVVQAGLLAMGGALLAMPFLSGQTLLPLGVALALLAAGQGAVGPSLNSLVSRAVPGSMQGSALGLAQSLSALARAIGPAAAGLLFDHLGMSSPFCGAAAVMGIAFCIALVRLNDSQVPATAIATNL